MRGPRGLPHGPLLAALACAAALLASPPPAVADVFGPISLVSMRGSEQVEYAHDPAISADGAYVVFDGSFGGVTGVWRRDLHTGEVAQVAGGDAELPSVSENGQYVSFTTNEGGQLVGDTDGEPHTEKPEAPNVYVRNMALAPVAAKAFMLVSAVSGPGEVPLSYESTEPTKFGAVAAGRTAISADGQEVAFVTTATSDLAGPGTPALQVAVRNLGSEQTRLVSTEYRTGGPVQLRAEGGQLHGAVFTAGGPPKLESPLAYQFPANPIGASISADGSTVAWLGQDIGAQALLLGPESLAPLYAEPLWRRIAEPPQAPSRRITGGSDPTSPACIESGETRSQESLSDPCQGPFRNLEEGVWRAGIEGESIPRLSRDGYTVAFLADAPPLSLGEDFGKASGEARNSDLYVVDMHEPGGRLLSRTEALTPLTELSTGKESDRTTNAPIVDLAISPDGSQVAFTTQRAEFPLPSLTVASVPDPEAGLAELYDVDLDNHTLTRVTEGFEGGPSERPHLAVLPGTDPYQSLSDGALSPSFTGDGDTLAFSSTASNLVYGDGNTPPEGSSSHVLGLDGSDVFLASRVIFGSTPAPQLIAPAPANPALVPAWALGVTALSQRNGTVRLDVELPGAGRLRAAADSAVLVRSVRYARGAHSSKRRRVTTSSLATRAVAATAKTATASAGGLITLTLELTKAYRALASRHGGLSANVSVVFSAHGQPTLHQSIAVTFLRTVPPAKSSKKPASKASRRR
ncbi:MAG TPA: hypothetical protein VKG38_01800 [Solirubrobacteraceae bacterium]|nr:hypothetical protein [Solirubrobacteraceae bacterium]